MDSTDRFFFFFKELMEFITSGSKLPQRASLSESMQSIVQWTSRPNPEERPTAVEVKKKLEYIFDSIPDPDTAPTQNQLNPWPSEAVGDDSAQFFIGWIGAVEREEAEQMLSGKPPGTFVTRWSPNRKGFVVSYLKKLDEGKGFGHLTGVQWDPEKKKLMLITKDGKKPEEFHNLKHYVQKHVQSNRLGKSLVVVARESNNYGFSEL